MAAKPVARLLAVPARSFFLFGPRGTGKSTWLRQAFPKSLYLDLLDTSLALELTRDPHRLEALVAHHPKRQEWVVLDEIQKIPALLDEVHRLMEGGGRRFALCGSSARKLKRGGADLLAGRALTLNMEGFSFAELKASYDWERALQWGTLPMVHREPRHAADILNAYVHTYIREEIKEEGIVRQAPPFLRFLQVAGLFNGQTVNASNIAREAGVPRASVDNYFSILVDTLLGHFLPAYQPGLKVRERSHSKFYWFDPGVARAAAGLLFEPLDRTWKGWALETLVFHELRVYNEVRRKHRRIAYYRTAAGTEVDFVIETRRRQPGVRSSLVCIEVKLAERWDRSFDRAMRDLAKQPEIEVKRLIGVYTGSRRYRFEDVEVIPLVEFFGELHEGSVF